MPEACLQVSGRAAGIHSRAQEGRCPTSAWGTHPCLCCACRVALSLSKGSPLFLLDMVSQATHSPGLSCFQPTPHSPALFPRSQTLSLCLLLGSSPSCFVPSQHFHPGLSLGRGGVLSPRPSAPVASASIVALFLLLPSLWSPMASEAEHMAWSIGFISKLPW